MTPAPLRVAFDATPAISGRTGIARYVYELAAALEREGIELRRYAVGRAGFSPPADTRRLPLPARVVIRWWRRIPWPSAEWLAGGGDVVHATGLLIPPTARPLVVTVHDTAALIHPGLHPARDVRQLQLQLAGLDRAAAILAVSDATAEDLVQLGFARERIVVSPLGVSSASGGESPDGLPARYLLTVGETSPRKGYGVLLHALSRLEPELGLVMAGPPAGDEQRLRALSEALRVSGRVTRLGAVPEAALAGLYQGALALCFPSLAEGFGLPVLEAMAAGLPVVARDIPPVRELAAGAAILVDRDEPDAWAHAIDAVTRDEVLRQRLIDAGRARSASYTWGRTARATLEAYRLALEAVGSEKVP